MNRLPCHKGVGRRAAPPRSANNVMGIANHQRKSTINNGSNSNRRVPGEVPYVSPDGGKTRYYADRYYLDAPTGLLEYQLENDKGKGKEGSSNNVRRNANVEHCNLCGEIREPQQIRGTLGSNKTPQPTRPLFDRAKFINSLDLSAAIVGTYTIGDFQYLSDEFPMLFPRSGVNNSKGIHVPTLVLHGQKGFSLEKWSSGDTQTEQKSEAKKYSTTEEPMGIRGGGGECSSQGSLDQTSVSKQVTKSKEGTNRGVECSSPQDATNQTSSEQITTKKKEGRKRPSAETKRPCFAYGGQKLKLPQTPKRPRTSKSRLKKKRISDNNVENNCKGNSSNAGDKSTKKGSAIEVIVIDSDSEDEPEPKESVKHSTDVPKKAAKMPPPASPKSPPASSTVNDKSTTLSPPLNIQKPRKAMPMKNAPKPQPLELAEKVHSSFRSKRLTLPVGLISMDIPPGFPKPKSAASILNEASDEFRQPKTEGSLKPDKAVTILGKLKSNPASTEQPQPKIEGSPKPDTSDAPILGKPQLNIIDQPPGSLPPQQTAGSILTRVLGKPHPKATMRPIYYSSGHDSSQDSNISADLTSMSADVASKTLRPDHSANNEKAANGNQPKVGWGGVKPASAFGGEVFFTQVLPRWRPPSPKDKDKKRRSSSSDTSKTTNAASAAYSDEEDMPKKEDEEMKTVRGVHHPKFFLLFERSGSLVVIISTSNLTPQNGTEGSWVQRFEPEDSAPRQTYINRGSGGNTNGNVDFGLPSDFGAVLTDFLKKQSDAAASGMMPDVFLRRCTGLSSGLNALSGHFRFDEAQVHLVSTVPGDHTSGLPRKGNRDALYKPRIAYGPQRVSFILSRILNARHIESATKSVRVATRRLGGSGMEAKQAWLPPFLVSAKDRLVIQPTSMGGNWTRDDLEIIVQSYLQPHWKHPTGKDGTLQDGPLELMNIVWPSMDYFKTMKSRRRAIWNKNPDAAAAITKQWASTKDNDERGEAHVFLSSVSFSKLDRACISRLSLFTHLPSVMPYKSTSLHIKSICRLLQLKEKKPDLPSSNFRTVNLGNQPIPDPKEYISWFMLTSACLSRGAQGQPTPYRDPASDSMSYSNFELGVLFCSRLVGDNVNDRLYVSDTYHKVGCQCGKGKRMYKFGKGGDNTFLQSVKKVHLPVPYQLRPKPYQEDPDSDFMSHTPYMHEILDGTGCVGNMKLTPLGQQIARDVSKEAGK